MILKALRKSLRNTLVVAALATLVLGPAARSEELSAPSSPAITTEETPKSIPLPGWIADNRDAWTTERPAYREKCATPEVIQEIGYLNELNTYQHELIKMTQNYSEDSATKRDVSVMVGKLRNDIATINILSERLRALPGCVGEMPPTTTEAAPPATTQPSAPNAAAPSGDATPSDAAEPNRANRFVIRFDDRLAALTPRGIRTLDEALAAAGKGQDIRLAIEGCTAADAKQPNSACARRLVALSELLHERGLRDPKRLLAEYQ
jgi:hypothetical protein